MPFKYALKWSKGETESITIDAWSRYPVSNNEKKNPVFTIGSVQGSRAIILRERVEQAIKKYGSRTYRNTIRVTFPLDDTRGIAEAYRIGLAAAVLKHAESNESVQKASNYVLNITDEEVWFWTSKLLDENIGPERTISALCVICGVKIGEKKPRKTVKKVPITIERWDKSQSLNNAQLSII